MSYAKFKLGDRVAVRTKRADIFIPDTVVTGVVYYPIGSRCMDSTGQAWICEEAHWSYRVQGGGINRFLNRENYFNESTLSSITSCGETTEATPQESEV